MPTSTAFRVNQRDGGNQSVNDTDPGGPSQVVPSNWRSTGPIQVAQALQTGPIQLAGDTLLFTNSRGRPIRATVWAKAWNESRRATRLDGVRLHDLRHLTGTLSAQAGATLREAMERLLGHSSADAAMRYQHVATERSQEVAKRIDDLL